MYSHTCRWIPHFQKSVGESAQAAHDDGAVHDAGARRRALHRAVFLFFFNDTATTEIYTSIDTLSLHDLFRSFADLAAPDDRLAGCEMPQVAHEHEDAGRSEEHTSELQSPIDISYAVFCLK